MHLTYDQLAHRFNHHPPDSAEKITRHEEVRKLLLTTAERLVDLTGPMSREQSTMVTKLEEAMFWANAAIAREITAPAEP